MSNLIEAKGLVKSFGRVKALDGLNLGVAKGQIHGFLGPNGAGKSTTIRVLLGMYHTDGGRTRVLGMDPAREASAINRHLAYVPGSVSLWPTLTGGQVLDTLAGLRGSRNRAREDELIQRFDLDPTKKVRTYSKGNAQKVALVAALSAPVDLLILDEPTSGLDPVARLEVLDILRDFLIAEGRTVLFSTHITSDLERIADHLHIIGAGRTRFAGTLPDLVEQWAMARGPVSALTPGAEAVLVGTRRNGAGAFAGLIRTADTAVFGPDVLIEPPSIDEAVVAMTRGPEPDRRSARSAAELAEKH